MNATDVIKVHAAFSEGGGESVFAVPLDGGRSMINSIPWFCPLALGDIVEIDASGEITAVLDRSHLSNVSISWPLHLTFDYTDVEELLRAFSRAVMTQAQRFGLAFEGAQAGLVAVMLDEDTHLDAIITGVLESDPGETSGFSTFAEAEEALRVDINVLPISTPEWPSGPWQELA